MNAIFRVHTKGSWKIITRLAASLPILVISACSENAPTKSELEYAFLDQFPAFVELGDFSVDASQNVGSEVEPVWISRLRGSLNVKADTYNDLSKSEFNPESGESAVFAAPSMKAGDSIQAFAKSKSVMYQGAWKTQIELEGDYHSKLGRPLQSFKTGAKTVVIVVGSKEELDWNERMVEAEKSQRLRAKQAELQAREKRARELKGKVMKHNFTLKANSEHFVQNHKHYDCIVNSITSDQRDRGLVTTEFMPSSGATFKSKLSQDLVVNVWFFASLGRSCRESYATYTEFGAIP